MSLRRAAGMLANAAGVVAILLVGLPGIAAAHTLSGKVDTPLPFVAYIAGAAVAVALSFLFVAISDPGPPVDPSPGTVRRVPRLLQLVLQAIGLIAWLWIVAQAIIGGESDADVASLFLWTYGWVGLAVFSALLGPAWSWIDPFTTLHDLGAGLLRRAHVEGIEAQPYPRRLGHWPAIAGFVFYVWLELVAHVISGRLMGVVLIGYTMVTLAGMAQYGRDVWRANGETFSVWFGTLGRLAPFALVGPPEERRVHRRPYATGLISEPWPVDLVVLVAIGTASILYDGISQTKTFYDVFGFPTVPAGTVLLAAFLGLVAAAVLSVGRRVGLAAMGAGLVPVALGYLVAHYLTSFVVDGQRIVIAISDPFQQGWDIFGTAFYQPQSGWLPSGVVWSLQVGAVVVGHIIGAWAGHAAVRGHAVRPGRQVSQLPLAVLMITLTSLTLWSLGQNLVFEQSPAAPAVIVAPVAAAASTSRSAMHVVEVRGALDIRGARALPTGAVPLPRSLKHHGTLRA